MNNVVTDDWGRLAYRVEGTDHGLPVVFIHALGMDLRLWVQHARSAP